MNIQTIELHCNAFEKFIELFLENSSFVESDMVLESNVELEAQNPADEK